MPGLSHKVRVVLSPCFATCWSQYYYWYQLEIISSFGCCARHENIIIMLCLCLSYLIFGTSHLQEKGRHHLVWTQWNERLRTENGDSILLLILRVWLRLAPLETQLVNPGHELHQCYQSLYWDYFFKRINSGKINKIANYFQRFYKLQVWVERWMNLIPGSALRGRSIGGCRGWPARVESLEIHPRVMKIIN